MALSPYELVQAMKVYLRGNVRETIEEANDLISDMEYDPKSFITSLAEETESFALNEMACPVCGCSLVELESQNESRGEYFGTPVSERVFEYGCNSCDFILS